MTTVVKEDNKIELKVQNYKKIYLLWLYSLIALGLILIVKFIPYVIVKNFYKSHDVFASPEDYNVILGINIQYFEDLLLIGYLIESFFLFFTLFLVLLIFINKEITKENRVLKLNSKSYFKMILIAVFWNGLTFFSNQRISILNSIEINFKVVFGLLITAYLLKDIEIPLTKEFGLLKKFSFLIGIISIIFFLVLFISFITIPNNIYNDFYENDLFLFDILIGIIYITSGSLFLRKLNRNENT